ncbi:STAS domain-containing protein [Pelomonas baiyunensis]|uniref:STAS domain-containing protein n=1 Tax=Pelomonas baiyunensis TaxID=3299026 RepID=A0ABW7GW60_9BURK
MNALSLPAELTIYTVAELHPQWLNWAAAQAEPEAAVDAHAVQDVDGAGLQLLLALHRQLGTQGRTLRLQAPSPSLSDACTALGLGAWLADITSPSATEAA